MEALLTPRAIVLDDDPADAGLMRLELMAVGFTVTVHTNLLAAINALLELLDVSQPVQPTFVLLDQQLTLPGYPALEGWLIAFLLRAQQQRGTLHPCWIGAISADLHSKRRDVRAREAQCDFLIDKGTLEAIAAQLYQRVAATPPPTPLLDEEHYLQHAPALAMLQHLAQHARVVARSWTPDEIYLLLGLVSDAIRLSQHEHSAAERLALLLGGAGRVAVRLRDGAHSLNDEQQEILRRLLRREQKREIQEWMPIGRTRLENEIKAICQMLAVALSRPS